MKKLFSVLVVVLVLAACAGTAQAVENAWKTAKIGDWVEYKSVADMGAMKMESTMKMEVVKKDEKSVTLKNEMAASGQKMPPQEMTIPFDAPEGQPQMPPGAKMEKVGEGDEKLTIAGKEYACHYVKNKIVMTMEIPNMPKQEMEQVATIWTCKDVPCGGMVRTMTEQMKPTQTKTVQELTGFGVGK